MDLTTAATVYCFMVATAFVALWMYYDRRDYALFDQARRKSTFHCIRCNHLYSAAGQPELCHCPKCNYENARLHF